MVKAIRQVRVSQQLISPLMADYLNRFAKEAEPSLLSPREREVLQLIAEGKTSPQIAYLLVVSESTVRNHRQNLMEKLDMNSVAQLTKYAIREGITSLEL